MVTHLIKKVKGIPPICGVYIFKDKKRAPLYVGKAGNLRLRMNVYLHPQQGSRPALFHMLIEADDIEIQKTDSEIEALILESKLIKTLRPRYNVLMRDDKQYFYVGFTNEPFPKIFITHQKKSTTNYKLQPTSYMGPFVSGGFLKITLRTLRKIFPYCTCKRLHRSERTCLNYNIGIDPGYCCVKKSKLKTQKEFHHSFGMTKLQLKIQNYKSNIKNIQKILKGQKVRVINKLEKQMKEAAEKKNFESAAKLRNQLEGIQKILAHKKVIRDETIKNRKKYLNVKRYTLNGINRIEGYDISNIQGKFAVGSMVAFARDENGDFVPQKNEYRKFKIKTIKGANDPAMIKEILARRLKHNEWDSPDLFLIDGGATQRNSALAVLQINHMDIKVWGLAKKKEELYTEKGIISLNTLLQNEVNTIKAVRDEAHRFAIHYYRKLHRKSLLSNQS